MRKFLLALLCVLANFYGVLLAQNKTLGIGVPTPNPNAALHVESPTGNQGFIMPRLTTSQRNAMSSLLTDADKGLMLYDTDLSALFTWDGTAWQGSSQFTIDDPLSTADGISVLTVGSGAAGRFTINNASSFSHAVYGESNGDSTSAAVHGNNTGNGFGVFGKSSGSKFASAAVYGEHVGVGDAAGAFRISNSANSYSALFGETNGSGSAVFGNQTGLGRAGQFQINNAANAEAALRGYTSGTGYAGFYTVNNPANPSAAIYSTTNGGGAAIFGEATGTGSAGRFVVNNVNSPAPALWAETNSDQPLSAPIYGLNTGTGDVAGSFRISNTANTFPALFAESNGTGRTATFRKLGAGGQPAVFIESQGGHGVWADHNAVTGFAAIFQTINATNTNAAVLAESVGTGPSVLALKSTDATSGDALRAENNIAVGSAATFGLTNATNTSPAIVSSTVGSGPAVHAENTGAADGFAATFAVTNPANNYPAVQASAAGNGSGVRVMQNTGMGAGMDVFMQNTESTAPGLAVDQGGLGNAASFVVNNNTNGVPAVNAVTNGTGAALEASTTSGFTAIYGRHDGAGNGNAALFEITNATNTYPAVQANTAGTGFAINARHTGSSGDAIYAEHAGAGSGSAGNFRISNSANSASALYAATNASGGNAISISNDANGVAFTIWNGGLQITTNVVSTASIATRASAYQIIGGGTTFTLDFGPRDGEIFMIYNETGATITVAGVTLLDQEGKTFVVFPGGVIRGF